VTAPVQLPRGGLLALVVAPDGSAAVAWRDEGHVGDMGHGSLHTAVIPAGDLAAAIAQLEQAHRPRWVWWANDTPARLLSQGVRVATCWDLAAVHRLLHGGWRAEPARIWAGLHDLPAEAQPRSGQLDLLEDTAATDRRSAGPAGELDGVLDGDGGDPESPIRPDQYLRPEWTDGGWGRSSARAQVWAALVLSAQALQQDRLEAITVGGDALGTARSESAAELLCAELQADGLPVDIARARELIASIIGPPARDDAHAGELRRARDAAVLAHAPAGHAPDLRNPLQVKTLLARVGIDVPDTRSWRLVPYRGAHPLVEPLLEWRRAERIATTYGYGWLERHVGADARLRGGWTGSDGAAGRMTAQAGLHNLPTELRSAIAAPVGYVLVRADLGQIEPRVLAVVTGDASLAAATQDDDLYLPVAQRLGVERAVAKVAVLAAMYGQTSGAAGQALKGLESAYPTAMAHLRAAYESGRVGTPVRTYGGRLVRVGPLPLDLDEAGERAALAGRGRYIRNAVIQGAAAELFKAWAATVRTRTGPLGARIVLCLHDELLVEAPTEAGDAVARALSDCLQEAARRWAPGSSVRFVADVAILQRWSEAKEPTAPPGSS
jgi:DNA polymerase-1